MLAIGAVYPLTIGLKVLIKREKFVLLENRYRLFMIHVAFYLIIMKLTFAAMINAADSQWSDGLSIASAIMAFVWLFVLFLYLCA